MQAARELDALVVGAGFAGLYQLHLLRDRLGLSVKAVEAGDDVGGTWYWNRYPGARCDSESHTYAYFFSRELYEGWEWTERFPGAEEIRRYLGYVATRLDLHRDIAFGRRVTSAAWDDASARWTVETQAGEIYRARWLVAAVGCLSSANVPDIPGLADFRGRWVHTGRWPREGVDFTGLRVGQVGTGSTGIQCAPEIAQAAAHLTVFQRTANFSIPSRNVPLPPERRRYFREHFAETREFVRSTPNGHGFRISPRRVAEATPDERRATYEAAWAKGGLQFRGTFHDLVLDKAANDTAAEFIKARIRETVKDPATAAILADIDHPFAAKRPPTDSGYFETFNRPNVSLVDLRADPIERITANGIRTRSREHPLDLIVFATGFDAMTGPLLAMGIRGRGGLPLREAWKAGPVTCLGLQVPGFPNLFTITGPGSPSVLTNMPVAIEQHAEWIAGCIAHLRASGATTIEPSAASAARWGEHVQEAANATLLPSVPHSWFLGANIPGKPRVFMPYAGGMVRYRDICDEVAAKGYEGFAIGGAGATGVAGRVDFGAALRQQAPGV